MSGETSAFDLSGDERGVLLIHGFTGTTFEIRFLGQRLHERGMTVRGLSLPGHGSTPADLDARAAGEWIEAVDAELDALARRCSRVAVVGQSLGGLLALDLAVRRGDELAGIAVLGTPLWLFPPARAVVLALRALPLLTALPALRKLGGSDVADRAMWAANPSYDVIPLRAFVQLDAVRRRTRARLEEVKVPVLVAHALHDHVAPFASAEEIARRVASRDVRLLVLPRSFHLIAMDLERERVAAETVVFLEDQLGG